MTKSIHLVVATGLTHYKEVFFTFQEKEKEEEEKLFRWKRKISPVSRFSILWARPLSCFELKLGSAEKKKRSEEEEEGTYLWRTWESSKK